MRIDWSKNLDCSVFRDSPIREHVQLQFRAEVFNATNTPVWGTPLSNYSNATVGQGLSVANTPRQMQFALTLRF